MKAAETRRDDTATLDVLFNTGVDFVIRDTQDEIPNQIRCMVQPRCYIWSHSKELVDQIAARWKYNTSGHSQNHEYYCAIGSKGLMEVMRNLCDLFGPLELEPISREGKQPVLRRHIRGKKRDTTPNTTST